MVMRMSYKEIAEAQRARIPEQIIGKLAKGIEPSEKEKEIIRNCGKVYVEAHKKDGAWVKPQLRDLPSGGKFNYNNSKKEIEDVERRLDIMEDNLKWTIESFGVHPQVETNINETIGEARNLIEQGKIEEVHKVVDKLDNYYYKMMGRDIEEMREEREVRTKRRYIVSQSRKMY